MTDTNKAEIESTSSSSELRADDSSSFVTRNKPDVSRNKQFVSENKPLYRETSRSFPETSPEDLPFEALTPAQKSLRLADGVAGRPIDDTQAIALAQVYALVALAAALTSEEQR